METLLLCGRLTLVKKIQKTLFTDRMSSTVADSNNFVVDNITIKIAENFDLSFSPAGPGQFLPASPICFAHKKVDSSAGRKPSSPSFAGMCFGMPPS